MSSARPRVAVCVATADRPVELRRLLASLPAGIGDAQADVDVIVVDNAPLGAHVVDSTELGELVSQSVRVVGEPRRGIPHARNRAVVEVVDDVETVVFVDDDEEVAPGWLRAHLDALARFDADVSVGPVIPVLPADAPRWAADGRFHRNFRATTGAVLQTAPSSNTAVRADVLRRVRPWFDTSLTASGGSDAELFSRLAEGGSRIVWVDEALSYEHIPAERVRLRWLLLRAHRVGAVESLLLRRRHALWSAPALSRGVRGGAHVVAGLAHTLAGTVLGRRRTIVAGLRHIARGVGMVGGLIGVRIRTYR